MKGRFLKCSVVYLIRIDGSIYMISFVTESNFFTSYYDLECYL